MKFVTKWLRPSDALLLAVALLWSLLYIATVDGGFPLDDSWIHQVYGRNLAETGLWSFVPGVPSAASTSPLYTVLLSVGYRLNIPYALWTHGLGVLALWGAGVLASRMVERLLPRPRYLSLLGGLAVISAWHLIWAAVSGMETMLFSLWTLALLLLAWRELDERSPATRDLISRGVIFGACAAFTTLTRPEGIVLTGLIGLAFLLLRPQKSLSAVLVYGVAAGVAFLLVMSPYLVFNLQLTGGLLPDTAAAKQAQSAPLLQASYPVRLMNMIIPLTAGGQAFLLPGVIWFIWRILRESRHDRQRWLLLLTVVWVIGLIALYAARLPAYYQHGRYVIPALPAFIVAGVIGTVWLVQAARSSLIGRVLTRTVAFAAVPGFIAFAFPLGANIYRQDVRIINEEMVAAAHWIQDNLPPDELLAIHDIGAVGYFAPRRMIDLAGLVSPEVVPFILDEEPLWDWMRRNDARYLMAFPDQVPGDDTRDSRLCLVFSSGGTTSPAAGGPNMAVYRLAWDGNCSS